MIIPYIPHELFLARIENWARCARSRGGSNPRGRCGSIESRYVAPRPDEEEYERSATRNTTGDLIDPEDAEIIETALGSITNVTERMFMILWYVKRARPKKIARQLNLRIDLHNMTRIQALKDLELHLRDIERKRKVANQKKAGYKSVQITAAPSYGRDPQPIG